MVENWTQSCGIRARKQIHAVCLWRFLYWKTIRILSVLFSITPKELVSFESASTLGTRPYWHGNEAVEVGMQLHARNRIESSAQSRAQRKVIQPPWSGWEHTFAILSSRIQLEPASLHPRTQERRLLGYAILTVDHTRHCVYYSALEECTTL